MSRQLLTTFLSRRKSKGKAFEFLARTRTITNLCDRNQENFVKRLINAESHFVQEGASLVDAVNRAHESREKY